ncbi:aminotransferase class I/II-fold pyridoxal phosphate-dependent enzyme [Aquirufa sp. Wall-65K1]
MDVNQLTITENCDIKVALSTIDATGLGTLFVVNENSELIGVLTDGDIRRALLRGVGLDVLVTVIMNRSFISLPVETDAAEILNNLNETIKIIPLVDFKNKLVDYASSNKIRRISVSTPLLNGNELAYVTECIKTNWVSSQGKYVKKFEEVFSQYHEGRKSLAVSNGTVALHLALEALKIGPGDEVIVPDLTFAASVNAILYTGAIPVLVDIDPVTWNIDISKIEKSITERTKAIMPVHLYGLPCEMDDIMSLATRYNLYVIEDCAEALGSTYHGKAVGTFGDVATFSFYGNKTITTGEGGMIVFKNEATADFGALLRDHGMSKSRRYWHDYVGFNYRITNLQAALGVAQFERLDEFVSSKIQNAKFYNALFNSLSYFETPFDDKNSKNSFWLYTCLVKKEAPFTRDQLIEFLNQKGIETRPVFYPMHMMPPYTQFVPHLIENSIDISQRGISLPSSASLSNIELEYIKKMVVSFVNQFGVKS